MPLFMDTHHHIEGLTADAVAHAHAADVKTQAKYGVTYLRYFAPALGIPEDPVTGSAHCILTPYWAARLGKRHLHAFQISPRGGELFCEDRGARVSIAGRAVKYLHGTIMLSEKLEL